MIDRIANTFRKIAGIFRNKPLSQPVAKLTSLNVHAIPRTLKIGPLIFDQWEAEFSIFFKEQLAARDDTGKLLRGYDLRSVDKLLVAEKDDIEKHYERHKDEGIPRIENWAVSQLQVYLNFNSYLSKTLKLEAVTLRGFSFAFLGIRMAQAYLKLKGAVPQRVIDSVNGPAVLGSEKINLRLYS